MLRAHVDSPGGTSERGGSDRSSPQLTYPRNAKPHDLTIRQGPRRLVSETYACGRSSGYHVPGLQTHQAANVSNQFRHPENHLTRVALLIAPSIHFKP